MSDDNTAHNESSHLAQLGWDIMDKSIETDVDILLRGLQVFTVAGHPYLV